MRVLSLEELFVTYCEQQRNVPHVLYRTLQRQLKEYRPNCWALLQCEDLSSSYCGSFTILAIGPNNSVKTVPTGLISPRGLSSDMSSVYGTFTAKELPNLLGPFYLKDVPNGTPVQTLDGQEGEAQSPFIRVKLTSTSGQQVNLGENRLVVLPPGRELEALALAIDAKVEQRDREEAEAASKPRRRRK